MPRLASFYGINIYMYFEDHPPPHVHARYGEHEAKVATTHGEVLDGTLPRRAARLVAEWVQDHSHELADAWTQITHGELPSSIEPLP